MNRQQLHVGHISQIEAIGQSLAGVAPTATPAMVVPLVLLTSGSSAWMTFLIATAGMLCMSRQINLFARRTASPGSLYSYVRGTLGARPSLIAAWALLIAYLATGSAAAAGFAVYALPLLNLDGFQRSGTGMIAAIGVVAIASFLAYRGVRLSMRVMLVVEVCSIALILLLFSLPGPASIWRVDYRQFVISHDTPMLIGRGLTLAIFSLVGFESATALGNEVKSPFESIPRAVWITTLASGLLFAVSAYAEFITFPGNSGALQENAAPLQVLAHLRGLPVLAPALSLGSAFSFFACILACCTSAARMIFQMSRDGAFSFAFGSAHVRHRTPHIAVALVGILEVAPILALTTSHVGLFDVYGLLGSLATCGFLTGYMMLLWASVVLSIRTSNFSISSVFSVSGAGLVILLSVWGTVSENSQTEYSRLPAVFAALLLFGIGLSTLFANPRSAQTF
jgi:amino acid transporter